MFDRFRNNRTTVARSRRGSILILVLWTVLILSIIVLSYQSTVRTSLMITGGRGQKVKARYYARAGIERTISELFLRTEFNYSESSGFYNDPTLYFQQPLGDGIFTLTTGKRLKETGEVIYGIVDEASRFNINTATEEQLLTFPELIEEQINSLLDWRDNDYEMRIDGAEDDYYSILEDPYFTKNREFQTIGELLLVRGWTDVDLFGEDANGNGQLDPNEDDGEETPPLDNGDGALNPGMIEYFTIYSADKEINPNGEPRIELASATEEQLRQVQGMNETAAGAIVQWRGNNQFDSLAKLFDVTQGNQNQQNQQQNQQSNQGGGGSRQTNRRSTFGQRQQPAQGSNSSSSGTRALNYEQVAQLVDWVCINSELKRGRVNINTAPYEVLLALPRMTESLANEIVTYRTSSSGFQTKGDIRNVNGMTEEIFRAIIDAITVQSYQFRIVAVGQEGEAKTTIETVVDISTDPPQTLYWREQ